MEGINAEWSHNPFLISPYDKERLIRKKAEELTSKATSDVLEVCIQIAAHRAGCRLDKGSVL